MFVVRRAARRARTARGLIDGYLLPARRERPVRLLCSARLLDQVAAVGVARRGPGARGPGLAVRVVVHLVDCLEGEVGGFVQEEKDKDGCEEIACCVESLDFLFFLHTSRKGRRTCKYVAVFVLDVACYEGREEREEEVPEPVGSGR